MPYSHNEGTALDTTQHTVPASGGAVPQGGTGAMPGGDAGATDLRTQLDELLKERLAAHKEEIWRGTQQVMDKRFSRLEPLAQQFPTVLERLNQITSRFQQADELDLPEDERFRRQSQREMDEIRQQAAQAANNATQQHVYALVMQQCAKYGISPEDGRLQSDTSLLQTNPWAWHATMIQQLADLRSADIEAANQARIEAEARRANQMAQRQQVESQNQQVLNSPRIDTTTPTGRPMDWHEKYEQLMRTNPAEARKYIENLAKQVRRGEVRTADQFR